MLADAVEFTRRLALRRIGGKSALGYFRDKILFDAHKPW
jgi:hypothetical protein